METKDGKWIMKGCAPSCDQRLRTIEDLYELIGRIGMLPLFSNSIPGFSVEERVTAESWWTGDPETDPWEWREIAAVHPDIAYGKFFEGKAGFVSGDFFPVFANYRRNGYDFEALFEDEMASYRAKKIMDAFELDEKACGRELMSNELKNLAGFGKRKDGTPGEKGFNYAFTDLQMQTYLIISGFKQRRNKSGQSSGAWHIAAVKTPETKWGYDLVTSAYPEDPAKSWSRMCERVRNVIPGAGDEGLQKVLGIRYPGTDTEKNPGKSNPAKKPEKPKRIVPETLPYPENLITRLGIVKEFEEKPQIPLTDDQMAGLEFAQSTLKEREQRILKMRYVDHRTFGAIAEAEERSGARIGQLINHALKKLRHPSRAQYYLEGLKAAEEKQERMKIKVDVRCSMNMQEIRDSLGVNANLPVKNLKLSVRACNCIKRAGIETLLELIMTIYREPENFCRIRNLGAKTRDEILHMVQELGVEIPEIYDHAEQLQNSFCHTYIYDLLHMIRNDMNHEKSKYEGG